MMSADPRALYLVRDEKGRYVIDQIIASEDLARDLILARDVVPSPFTGEPGVVYATGYNASVATDPQFVGRGWVYRGRPTARFRHCTYTVAAQLLRSELDSSTG